MSDMLSPGRLHLEAVAVAGAPLLVLTDHLWDRVEVRCALYVAVCGVQLAAWLHAALTDLNKCASCTAVVWCKAYHMLAAPATSAAFMGQARPEFAC